MIRRPPSNGTVRVDAPAPGSRPGSPVPRPDSPPRITVEFFPGANRSPTPGTSHVPGSADVNLPTPELSVTIGDLVIGTGQPAGESLPRPLSEYQVVKVAKLPTADADGLRTLNGRQYVDVEYVGVVHVVKDPVIGQYRAKLLRESVASGPILLHDPDSKLWYPYVGEATQLQEIAHLYSDFVDMAFNPDVPDAERFDFLRGLQWLAAYPKDNFLWKALAEANVAGDWAASQQTIKSVEALPDLQRLMTPEQFEVLTERMFTAERLVPLTEFERNLGAYARNLEQTGRFDDYDSLQLATREARAIPEELQELRDTFREHGTVEQPQRQEPTEVTAQVMSNLQQAQRAIYRAKELLPLSGNQLPSIFEKGGAGIAKIKSLRKYNAVTQEFTADMTIAEHAQKAIEIKSGNCSENSKVVFSILANQPRISPIHIVQATLTDVGGSQVDHQYVLIGDLDGKPSDLVVADSWVEFPAAHTVDKGKFNFKLPALETLEPGPAVAEYGFINDTAPGPAMLPAVVEDSTIRELKISKMHKNGYAEWISLETLGSTYHMPGEVPVSFEKLPLSAIEQRSAAYERFRAIFRSDTNATQ